MYVYKLLYCSWVPCIPCNVEVATNYRYMLIRKKLKIEKKMNPAGYFNYNDVKILLSFLAGKLIRTLMDELCALVHSSVSNTVGIKETLTNIT